ncbi:MAG: hypothetical protein AAFW60_09615, partial [Pseudomonadota bacterium]
AARVRLYGSTSARGRDLLQAEREARMLQTGLWALMAYAPQDASAVDLPKRGFQLIHARLGRLLPVSEDDGYPPACRRELEASTLVIRIDRDAGSACGITSGTRVELRGWLADGELRLQHPLHLSVLSAD